jgi:hypothetical protein
MRYFILTFVSAICLLVACTPKGGKRQSAHEVSPKPFVFNMNLLYTDAENYVSFPIWFDDSVIRAAHISKISREIIGSSVNDDNSKSETPHEIRDYHFNVAGFIDSMIVRYFFDDEFIGKVNVVFTSEPDFFGFANSQQWMILNAVSASPDVTLDPLFKRHLKDKQSNKSISYMEIGNSNHLHCMLVKKYWGPLSVDSIVHPSKADLIVHGTMRKPFKKYSVLNTVNEQNVQQFTYFEKSFSPKTITRDEYPFLMERTFQYMKNGICNGFIDSTFSKKNFLATTKTHFEFGENFFPIKVTKTRENAGSSKVIVGLEKFQYYTYD